MKIDERWFASVGSQRFYLNKKKLLYFVFPESGEIGCDREEGMQEAITKTTGGGRYGLAVLDLQGKQIGSSTEMGATE